MSLEVFLLDLLLSGDNAVVIALACRSLPDAQRKKGIFWGVAGAVSLRVVLTVFAALVMNLPWLKAIGGLLLVLEDLQGAGAGTLEMLQHAARSLHRPRRRPSRARLPRSRFRAASGALLFRGRRRYPWPAGCRR